MRSISAEDIFPQDIRLAATEPVIRQLAERVCATSREDTRTPRTVVLKLKTAGFETLTRSVTPAAPPASCEEFTSIALSLRERVALPPAQLYRLVGVGLSNFREGDSPAPLFGSEDLADAELRQA